MYATTMRKIAAVGAGSLLLLGAGAGVASAETQEEATARAKLECAEGYLCVWDDFNYTGQRTDFFECSDLPIDLRYTLGSFMNRQYAGTVAHFYGPAGEHQYSSTAPEDSPNDKGFETWEVDPC